MMAKQATMGMQAQCTVPNEVPFYEISPSKSALNVWIIGYIDAY